MLALAVAATLLTLPYQQQVALARADYAAYGSSARYLDFSAWGEDYQEDADLAWRFFAPHITNNDSLSHEFHWLERTQLMRVDIDALGWSRKGWTEALKTYPYAGFEHSGDLLIARADWILAYAADADRKSANKQPQTVYYSLLFGGTVPKNKKEWLALFGIIQQANERLRAQLIDDSGVAHGRRLYVHHRGSTAGVTWDETFDSERPFGKQDPALGIGNFVHDAQELIVEMPKVLTSGSRQDTRVQAYLLTDGQGNRVDFADTDIVEDNRHFRGLASVRTPGSCINCHTAGINGAASNLFVEFLQKPGEPQILVKSAKEQAALDPLYLSNLGLYRKRANEDVAAWALEYLQTDPRSAVDAWLRTVNLYDEPLDLAQAARELHCQPETLRLALGYYNAVNGPQPQFLDAAGLAHGKSVSRGQWEEICFGQCFEAVQLWGRKQ